MAERKWNHILLGLMVLIVVSLLWACGDDDSEEDGDADGGTGPIAGEMFLGGDDNDYQVPHLFTNSDNDTVIVFRNANGIYAKNLTLDQDTFSIPLLGNASPAYGVTQYAVNANYFAWNANTAQTFRYQWVTATTQQAQTGPLAPGCCIIKDRLGNEAFVAAQPGGYMYSLTLNKFTDASELANRTTLLDPQGNSDPVSVQSFACAGQTAYVGTTDGRLFAVNLYDNTPTLDGPLVTGEYYGLLQYSQPYVIWLDANGDIKMYNVVAQGDAVMAVNIDPVGRTTAPVQDMRIFGSVVVWSDDSEGDYNLWASDLANFDNNPDTNYIQVTNETHDQRFPFLNDGMLYWQDNRDGVWEIYKGSLPPL